jgi:hypothetical protein
LSGPDMNFRYSWRPGWDRVTVVPEFMG